MSIVLVGSTSGSITLQEPAVAGTTVLDLPATSGTIVVTGGAQTIEFADGSAATPSITNSGDTNTGIFFPAADTIAFTEGGVESMRITSAGNVGIGTSSPASLLAVNGVGTFGSLSSKIRIGLNGDSISSDGDFYIQTSSANPLILRTNGTERMRINAGAPVLCLAGGNISATGTGIAFPATQSASSDANTLDDYEEGTWTPSYIGSIVNPIISQVTSGSYTKIGRFVFVTANMHTSSITSVGSGDLRVGGLPFAVGSQSSAYGATIGLSTFFITNPGAVQSEPNQTYITLYRNINNTVSPTSDLQAGAFNNVFRFSFAYIV